MIENQPIINSDKFGELDLSKLDGNVHVTHHIHIPELEEATHIQLSRLQDMISNALSDLGQPPTILALEEDQLNDLPNQDKAVVGFHMLWMIHELKLGRSSVLRMQRWFSWIQGVMSVYGWTTVRTEREYTREPFKSY